MDCCGPLGRTWFTTGPRDSPGRLSLQVETGEQGGVALGQALLEGHDTIHRDGSRCEAACGRVAFVLGKPIDGGEGRKGRPDLQGQYAEGLPGNLGKPLQREKRNQRDLCGHEDLEWAEASPKLAVRPSNPRKPARI